MTSNLPRYHSCSAGTMSQDPCLPGREFLDNPNRVWTNPNSPKDHHSLVCLKPEALCLAFVPAADLEETAAALADGGEVVAQTIPLGTIVQLEGGEADSLLSISYTQGDSETASVTVWLVDGSKRDELLDALRNRLGASWTSERTQESLLSALGLFLFGTAFIAFFTWFMYDDAQEIAAGRQPELHGTTKKSHFVSMLLQVAARLLGPTGVLILAGLLIVLLGISAAEAAIHPPARITVRPK